MSSDAFRLDPHKEAYLRFMQDFVHESDRAAVILGAAKVESLLGTILDKYLIPTAGSRDELLDNDAPISTFSARINVCHRLGLIDTHFCKLLHTFRRLRNPFAHEVDHSSLNSGAARDRVLSMAEPFVRSKYYGAMLQNVADDSKRDTTEPGVIFRAVLSLFYFELDSIRDGVEPIEHAFGEGIVETVARLNDPFESKPDTEQDAKQAK